MKNQDFEGIQNYKLIMPGIFVMNIFLFFFGRFYCPIFSQILYFVWSALICLKCVHMGIMSFYCLYQNNRVIKRAQSKVGFEKTQKGQQILHAIIIPNFNEPTEVLRQNLNTLSKHTRSTQSYLIYLAMEKHEKDSDQKARKLITEFRSKFKNIDFTLHQLSPGEYKSKASNVNWCAMKLGEKLQDLNIHRENCFLTIIDVDASLLELYFDELEDHINANWEKRFKYVYGSFNIFAKNNMEVPAVTRVYDQVVSSFQAANIATLTGFGFAISNYTMSYVLAQRIGFWDTNEDSITQDLHFMQKACWKTQGQMETVPIYVPINEMNIQTGDGYWADIKAKFWQSERHCRCCNEIAYSLRMFFNEKFNWKTFKMVLIVFDTLALQVFYPIVYFSLMYQKSVMQPHEQANLIVSFQTMDFLTTVSLLATAIFATNFQIITRRSKEKLFGGKNPSWFRFLETSFMFFIFQNLVVLPTNIYAIFASLKSNRQWFMAGRGNTKTQTK